MKLNLCLFVVLGLLACQKKQLFVVSPEYAKQKSQIVNGELTDASKTPFNSVVGLYDSELHFMCTGTLIASSTILTAGHCVQGPTNNLVIVFSTQLKNTLEQGLDVTQNVLLRKTSKIVVHPDYEKEVDDDEYQGENDIAIVHFEGALPQGYVPAVMDKSQPKPQERIILAGFGVTDVKITSLDGSKISNIQDLIDEGSVMCFDKLNKKCAEITMTGDGVLRNTTAPVEEVSGFEFLNDETDSGTCSGDSGGPAFRQIGATVVVLTGVTSRGSLTCNKAGVYTIVSKYAKWISTYIK